MKTNLKRREQQIEDLMKTNKKLKVIIYQLKSKQQMEFEGHKVKMLKQNS